MRNPKMRLEIEWKFRNVPRIIKGRISTQQECSSTRDCSADLGGSFVEKVQQHWWPEYSWRKSFWFNTGYFVIMIGSVVAYDFRGGNWLMLPLAWAIERFCNGFWHVGWAIRFREYSPGLVSSILMWMNFYFIVRYRPVEETIAPLTLWGAVIIGVLATAFLTFYFPLVKGRTMRARAGA
jgi:hypothetical protein